MLKSIQLLNFKFILLNVVKEVKKMRVDANRLQTLMIEKKMSLKELASKAGISPVTLSTIFKNGVARYKTIGALVYALNIKPAEIISLSE